MLGSLGVNVEKLHYRLCKGGKSLEESLRIVYDDASFNPLLSILYKDNCIDLYVKYDEKPNPFLSDHDLKEVCKRLGIDEHGRTINGTVEGLIDDGDVVAEVEARGSMVNDHLTSEVNQEVNNVAEQNEESCEREAESEDSSHYNQDHLVGVNYFSNNSDEELAETR